MSEPRRNEDPAAADYRGRRAMDEAKFSTQRVITYFILGLFAGVAIVVFLGTDQAERSTVLQTIINFTVLAIGFWLGTSKGAADQGQAMSRIVEATAAQSPPAKPVDHPPAAT